MEKTSKEQRQLTLGSLFSGSGTFELAGLMSGVTPVWSSDIEPFPVRVTTKRLPFVKHYGNVSDISGEDIEPVDIITFGSPCFPAGTLVLTKDGYVEIEKVSVGMKVFTHQGRWRGVLAVGHKKAETVILNSGRFTLECTPNHPIYSVDENGNEEWVAAEEMRGRKWCVPNSFNHNGLSKINMVGSRGETGLHAWAYFADESWRQGYLAGVEDKYATNRSTDHKVFKLPTKKFAYSIRLLGESLGWNTTTHCLEDEDAYVTEFFKEGTLGVWERDDKHTWQMVDNVIPTGETKTVYNLSVEEDNSYVADGVVVHNCQDMSMAGKRSGLDGSRSCLFYEAIRIIKEMRRKTDGVYPTFALWENVPGAFTSNDGDDFRAVLEALCQIVQPEISIPRPEDGRWKYAGCIMGEGYSIAWRTLDAQYFGVPQRRRRIYLVADFNGERAPEVLFKSEGVSGYSKEGFRAWQNSTRESEGGVGVSGWDGVIASWLNHGGERVNIAKPQTTALRASEHPHIIAENIEEKELYDNHIDDARYNGPLRTAPTIISRYGTGGNNQPLVVKREDAGVYCSQDSTTGQQTKNTLQESDINKNAGLMSNNATCHTVAYGLGGYKSNSMLSDNPYSGIYLASTSRTLDTSGATPACNQGGIMIVEENETVENNTATNDKTPLTTKRHTVRKLTPTECARLQGFPDWWCSDLAEENPSEDEMEFWEGVFEDNRKAVTPDAKPKTKASIKRWLQNPYSDSAEYKMWGNGMALPCAYFVMSGVVWAYNNTEEC